MNDNAKSLSAFNYQMYQKGSNDNREKNGWECTGLREEDNVITVWPVWVDDWK